MGNYSQEEIRAFAEKDRRIVRQSSLKVATDIVLHIEDIVTEKTVLKVKEIAQELTDWVYEKDQDDDIGGTCPTLGSGPAGITLEQLPVPTSQQKKMLDIIAGKQNKTQIDDQLKTDVLRWAEEVYGQWSYPTKLDSVDTFINWYNK